MDVIKVTGENAGTLWWSNMVIRSITTYIPTDEQAIVDEIINEPQRHEWLDKWTVSFQRFRITSFTYKFIRNKCWKVFSNVVWKRGKRNCLAVQALQSFYVRFIKISSVVVSRNTNLLFTRCSAQWGNSEIQNLQKNSDNKHYTVH